jgi:ABC-type transporter Mla subunit MlaD
METRANYVIVGIFTLVAVLAAFAFVYWTAGVGDRSETAELRIRIPGSASGLTRGSAVLFNGVRVGDLRRVYIDVNDPDVAIAEARVDRRTPITASTQVDVGLAGLTGQANIEMRGARPGERSLLDIAQEEGRIAEITARPSAVADLLESAQSIFRRADTILGEFEDFVDEVRGPLTESARNAQAFTDALGRNAEGIDTFLASVSDLSETFTQVSGQLEATLQAGEELRAAGLRHADVRWLLCAGYAEHATEHLPGHGPLDQRVHRHLPSTQPIRRLEGPLVTESRVRARSSSPRCLKSPRHTSHGLTTPRRADVDQATAAFSAPKVTPSRGHDH